MRLDIAIPAHNEADVILDTLYLVSRSLEDIPSLSWKIIVAENGSTDDTYALVKNAQLPNVDVFSASKKGKGAALKEAAARSQGDYFGFIDADCSPDPRAIRPMLEALEAGVVHLAVGSRFHRTSEVDRALHRQGSSWLFNILAQLIVDVGVDDTQCPLKIMTPHGKALFLTCEEDTWFLDLEFLGRAKRKTLPTATFPIVWKEFRYPLRKSKLNMVTDGKNALRTMLELRKRLNKEEAA